MRVLFVCSGNICRSPMAAEYMRRRASETGLGHVVVESAGLLGIEAAPASAEAVEVLREEGLDLAAHRSRGIRDTDLRSSDLVLVMTRAHREEIQRRFPRLARRVELLRAFERGADVNMTGSDLDDPMGCPVEAYRDCFRTIRSSIEHLLLHLKHGR